MFYALVLCVEAGSHQSSASFEKPLGTRHGHCPVVASEKAREPSVLESVLHEHGHCPLLAAEKADVPSDPGVPSDALGRWYDAIRSPLYAEGLQGAPALAAALVVVAALVEDLLLSAERAGDHRTDRAGGGCQDCLAMAH
jgi:hypothetical protein